MKQIYDLCETFDERELNYIDGCFFYHGRFRLGINTCATKKDASETGYLLATGRERAMAS